MRNFLLVAILISFFAGISFAHAGQVAGKRASWRNGISNSVFAQPDFRPHKCDGDRMNPDNCGLRHGFDSKWEKRRDRAVLGPRLKSNEAFDETHNYREWQNLWGFGYRFSF